MKRLFAVLFVFGVLFAALGNAHAVNYSYTYLDIPGQVADMNDSGRIVGSFQEAEKIHGFVYKDLSWIILDLL